MIVKESDRVAALLDRMEGFAGGAKLVLAPLNIHEILDHCLRNSISHRFSFLFQTRSPCRVK